jgi:hypothetical protein
VRAGAERAVRNAAAGDMRTLHVGPPVSIEIDVPKGVIADHAAMMPGGPSGSATGPSGFVHDDPVMAYRGFLAMIRLMEPASD